MADETTRLILDIVGRDRGGKKALTDVGRAAEDASDEVKGLDKASDKAGTSLKDLGKDADRLTSEIKKTEKNIQDLAQEIKRNPGESGLFKQLSKEQAQLRRLNRVQDLLPSPDDGKKAGNRLVAGIQQGLANLPAVGKKSVGALGAVAGTAALGAGVAAGALLMQGITESLEKSRADSILRAQLGKTVPVAGDVGKLSGKIYADNFGGSIQEVNQALKDVIRQGLVDARKASASEIKGITEDVLTVATVTEETTDRVAAAATQLVRTGLARNVAEALDLITAASQQGTDKAGDLLDTINEYGTQFRKLGISGPEALGLLSQGLQAGARDADIVADSLKELSIRAVDGSKLTAKGFRDLGLDADQMRDAFGRGGLAARQALDLTLDRLRAVPDPANRSAIAVELFGTQAEDLGSALYALDLDTAARQMDGFAGSTKKASEAISAGTGAETSAALRKLKTEAIEIGNSISDTYIGLAKKIPGVNKLLGESGDEAEETGKKFSESNNFISQGLREVQSAAHGFNESLKTQTGSMRDAITAAGGLSNALDALTGNNVDAQRAEADFEAAIDSATAAIDGKVKKIDLGTERGRAYQDQLFGIRDSAVRLAEATYQQTGSQEKANAVIARARTQLYNTARQMGLSKEEAHRYVDQILQIPKQWTTNVSIPTKSPLANVKTIQRAINNIHGKTIGIHVSGPGGSGTQIAGSAAGGPVTGPGPKGQDSVLKVLAPGEHVFSDKDVDAMGGQAAVTAFRKSLHSGAATVRRFNSRQTSAPAAAPAAMAVVLSWQGGGTPADEAMAAWFHNALGRGKIQARVDPRGRVVKGV